MSFFPPDPEMPEHDEPEQKSSPWWSAPEDELPALLPTPTVLAVTDHVAIALLGAFVYSDGVEFRVERRLRRIGLPAREWNELCASFMEHHPWGGSTAQEDRLRFGLVLGDGERVFADASPFLGSDPTAEPQSHTLSRRGGGSGGGGSSYSGTDGLWLWPSPPAGSIELVIQWPVFGIDERRATLDGDEILALSHRAQPFWS